MFTLETNGGGGGGGGEEEVMYTEKLACEDDLYTLTLATISPNSSFLKNILGSADF